MIGHALYTTPFFFLLRSEINSCRYEHVLRRKEKLENFSLESFGAERRLSHTRTRTGTGKKGCRTWQVIVRGSNRGSRSDKLPSTGWSATACQGCKPLRPSRLLPIHNGFSRSLLLLALRPLKKDRYTRKCMTGREASNSCIVLAHRLACSSA